MKIIEQGNADKKQDWWIGKEATCDECRTRVELEASDTPSVYYSRPLLQDIASVVCPNCGGVIRATRSTWNPR